MELQDLKIREDDFELFVELNPREKIEFLFDASRIGVEASIIKQVDKLQDIIMPGRAPILTQDFNIGNFKLCVTTMMDEIHLNSNSIKAIRKFVAKLWNDGLMLRRVDIKKSEFDTHRFFRAYKILGKGDPFCPN